MNRKNMLALILAALLLPSSMTACGESQTETTADTMDNTATDTVEIGDTDMEGREAVSDDLPEKDFEGADFTILSYNFSAGYMYAEELTGEAFNDALYNRDTKVSDRFHVNIVTDCSLDYTAVSNAIKTSVTAGEDVYDLIAYQYVQMGVDVLSDVYMNFRDVPYINFDNPWWNSSTDALLTYKGRTFLALGSLNLSTISGSNCCYYNLDIAEQYEMDDIFSIVNEGHWTLDKLIEGANVAYVDTNGNGKRDNEDQFGFVYSQNMDMGGIQVYDKLICEFDDNGNLVLDNYYDEKLISIVEKLYSMQYEQEGIWSEAVWNLGINMFVTNQTLSAFGNLSQSQWGLRDADIDYAIIPIPKWSEEQEKYVTAVGGDTQAVLRTAGDLEMLGVIIEALNAESWRTCESAYYENTIKYKSTRREENLEILDMMMENRAFDFGVVYGGFSGANNWIYQMINSKSKDIASTYQSKKAQWEAYMAEVAAVFENYEG